MTRRIFHIDLDAFFVAVERALDPSLEGKPVAVGGEAGQRGVVTCASYEARPYGLRAGMPLAQAQRLCPHAIFIPGRFRHYQEVSQQFMDILAQYTPFVEPLGIDEAFLDMTGFESLYGPLESAARRIKEQVRRELRITASIGIASSKVVAKVASDRCKPDGLLEIPPGEDARFIAPLPIQELPGIGEKVGKKLEASGVSTVGQVAALHPTELRRMFGAWGDLLHLWARGQDHSPVSPLAPAKSISRETTFERDTLDMEVVRGMLRYLSERVGYALRMEGKLTRCVSLKLRYADFSTITRQQTLKRPSDTDEAIFDAIQQLLSKALKERREKVRLIGVGVSNLIPSEGQLALLRTQGLKDQDLSRAMDTIREKYGFNSVQRGLTFALRGHFPQEHGHFILKTASLSR